MEGTVTFSVTYFAWASSYVLSVPLGGALIDPRCGAIFHPFLTVVCFIMLLMLRRVACWASD
jgi:predicted Co/Zn/Cd cation transporter (cation efflux family)